MEERAIYVDIDPNDIHDAEPELLFDSHYRAKQIMLDYGTEPLIKAGSPISASGKVSNNASAIGILKRDCYRHLTSVGDVIIGGYIKSDIAQSHSGIEISDAARAAMSRLAFIGADGIPQPAAGGGVFTFTFTVDVTSHTWTADKTYEEIVTAVQTGKPAFGISMGRYFNAFYFASIRQLKLMSSDFSVKTVGENATGTIHYDCVILNSNGSIELFNFSNDVSGMEI